MKRCEGGSYASRCKGGSYASRCKGGSYASLSCARRCVGSRCRGTDTDGGRLSSGAATCKRKRSGRGSKRHRDGYHGADFSHDVLRKAGVLVVGGGAVQQQRCANDTADVSGDAGDRLQRHELCFGRHLKGLGVMHRLFQLFQLFQLFRAAGGGSGARDPVSV